MQDANTVGIPLSPHRLPASRGAAPDCNELGRFFGVLAHSLRLRIVLLLAEGERSVNLVCEELKQPQPTVSHHLGILRAAGVVETRRASRQIFYRLRHPSGGAGAYAGVMLEAAEHLLRFTLRREPSPNGGLG